MPRLPISRLMLLAALPLLALPAFTQNDPQTASPAAPSAVSPDAKPDTKLLEIINADTGYVYPQGKGKTYVLTGHVHIKQDDAHFFADRIIYNDVTKKGEATGEPKLKNSIGNPYLQDETHHLIADKMLLDFSATDARKKYVTALGHVRFTAKPDPVDKAAKLSPIDKATKPADAKKDTDSKDADDEIVPRRVKEETVLTCDRLDYYYRTRRAIAEGNLKVVQGKRWLTGDQAIYYKRDETVVVNGNVKGEDEKGRTFAANNLKVVLTGDTETIQASKFTGTFVLEDEEESPNSSTKEPAEEHPAIFPGSDESEGAPPASETPPESPAPSPPAGPSPASPP